MNIRQALRKLLAGAAIAGVIVGALFALYVGFLLASPYDAKPIPTMCTTAASHFPGSRTYDLPGLGTGALVTSDSSTVVLLMANYGAGPFAAHVYVVDRATNSVDAGSILTTTRWPLRSKEEWSTCSTTRSDTSSMRPPE